MNTLRALVGLAALAVLSGTALPAPAAPDEAPLPPWEFPKQIVAAGRKVELSEPVLVARDPESGDVQLRFAAQEIDGAGRISWGMVEAAGSSHIDFTGRLVLVDGVKAGSVLFPLLPEKDRDEIAKGMPEALPKELVLRLEILTAGPGAAPTEPEPAPKFSISAPEIVVRRTPAVLVQIDGEPVKDTVADFPLEYVVNTASDLFRDPKSGTWYLLADGAWLESSKLNGEWKLASQTPVLLSQLPATHPRGHVRSFVQGTPEFAQRTGGKKPAPPAVVPEVIVREKPAELILLLGDPLLTMVPGVKLLAVANTASDMLYHPKTAQFFLCFSGRWFSAEDGAGPWREALGGLPDEFKHIPRDHVRANVLWCVPGTPEAAEAAALSALEERVTVTRATSITVQYDGKEMRTVPVDGADVKLVVNTDDDVFEVDGAYWCCARGVWFHSDDGKSAWTLATEIPKSIEGITESTGAYQVRSVRPLGAVEGGFRFGATGGYSGVFLWKGAPIYGTGYSRRGLLRSGNWYPSPRTYGENRWYDPLAGVFQPRTVTYDADLKATASEWSPYTASYGRVGAFADRYGQGGRRMFPWILEQSRFDVGAGRPDPYAPWGTQVKEQDGILVSKLPWGDRTTETAPQEPAIVADAAGAVWRLGAKSPETGKDAKWQPAEGCGAAEAAWLDAFTRIHARPAQLRTWAEQRRGALPVNPIVTK